MSLYVGNQPFSHIDDDFNLSRDVTRQLNLLLSEQKYEKAAETVSKYLEEEDNSFTVNFQAESFRHTIVSHLNKSPDLIEACAPLLEVLVALDVQKDAYGLHTDWIPAELPCFQAVVKLYRGALSTQGLSTERIAWKFAENLGGLLTYRHFRCEQAKILIDELPGFDPRKPLDPSYYWTFLGQAKTYGTSEMISYLESLSPAPLRVEVDFSQVDYSEFCGVEALKGMNEPRFSVAQGEFAALETVQKIYAFIGERNPIIEGDLDFFKGQVIAWVEQYENTLEGALNNTRITLQRTLQVIESLDLLLKNQTIEVVATENMILDTAISGGRSNIGTLLFNNTNVVCKFESTIFSSTSAFETIHRISDFVLKSRALQDKVPNVVEIFPHVVLNKLSNGKIEVGYLMELAPGKQLREISILSVKEKQDIEEQFNKAVQDMLTHNYALYDFNDDNVLWDGKKLTFIDLSSAGFTPEALERADTWDVIYRMSQMLEDKGTR